MLFDLLHHLSFLFRLFKLPADERQCRSQIGNVPVSGTLPDQPAVSARRSRKESAEKQAINCNPRA